MAVRRNLWLPLLVWIGSVLLVHVNAQQECERLPQTLEYTQEEAPRDFTKVLGVVRDELNKVLDGVVSVDVEWNGSDLHGRVGEHIINCKVNRLASMIPPEVLQRRESYQDELGRQVITQCFQVPFTIYDTNECKLPPGHDMRHQCEEPAICVNTIGSYECLCPRLDGSLPPGVPVAEDSRMRNSYSLDVAGSQEMVFFEGILQEPRSAWEVSINRRSSSACASRASTRGCCPEVAHSRDGQDCRRQFQCPFDPCPSSSELASKSPNKPAIHQCDKLAQCVRRDSPREDPNYNCACPQGLLGSGRICRKGDEKPLPKVTFDGVPTEETLKSNFCGCTKPTVDACAGFPPCVKKHEVCVVTANNTPHCGCKKGFVKHPSYDGCVDEQPPGLKLIEDPQNDHTMRLKQGDFYKEHGVQILDANAEDYQRLLSISYSDPVPRGCLTQVGEFHVNYTMNTPWTHPSSVVLTRRVIIEDIDECSLDVGLFESTCPQLIPRCDVEAGAKCVNTIGSYNCECPKFTSGDGFQPNANFVEGFAPEGFKGGTSCHDTSKPVIELKGPNPKTFRIAPCGGLSSIIQGKASDDGLREAQRQHYESDIKDMIKATKGLELCATHENKRPTNCVNAYDETYKGKVDLSSRVTIGDPVQKKPLLWEVPYNVKDDAGNAAMTVWRDIVVEEVDFDSMEAQIREQERSKFEIEKQKAVDRAVEEERKRQATSGNKRNQRRDMTAQSCPACPPCSESKSIGGGGGQGTLDMAQCEKICEQRGQTCSATYHDHSNAVVNWLEQIFPVELVPWLLGLSVVLLGYTVSLLLMRLLFNPSSFAQNKDYGVSDARFNQELKNDIYVLSPEQRQQQQQRNFQLANTPMTPGGALTTNGPPRQSMSTMEDNFFSPTNSPRAAESNGFAFGSPPPQPMLNSGGLFGSQSQPNTPAARWNGNGTTNNTSMSGFNEEVYQMASPPPRMSAQTPRSDRGGRSPGWM